MPIGDFIQVTTRFASPPLGVPSLNIPIVAAVLTTDQNTAWDTAFGAGVDVTPITGANWDTTLETLGVTSGEDLQVALQDMFSQSASGQPAQPDTVVLARRATPVAQISTVTIVGTTDGDFTATINGTAFVHTAAAQTATQIRDALRVLIDAGSEPVGTADSGADAITITANEAGVPFTISVTHSVTPADISLAATTPNTGIGEDIANWRSQRDDWTFFLETTRSQGVIETAATTLEALQRKRIFLAQTSDSLAQNAASTDDLASRLGSAGLGLIWTAVVWHNNDDEFVDFALVGKLSAFDPGTPNWARQGLSSVTGIFAPNLTSPGTLETKRYTFLESFRAPIPPVSSTRGGQMLDGNWIDIVHGVLAVNLTIEIRVFEAQHNNNLPYQGGEPPVAAAILGALAEFEGPPGLGFLVAGESTVNVPAATSQSPANRTARTYDGVTWGALAQGKANTIIISGFLEQ